MDSELSSRPPSWTLGDAKDEKVIGVSEDTYSGSEYERFLTLEAAFEGSAKKKLLRKREFIRSGHRYCLLTVGQLTCVCFRL